MGHGLVRRFEQSAREIERFARSQTFTARDEHEKQRAYDLLRHAVGVRKTLEQWPGVAPPMPMTSGARR